MNISSFVYVGYDFDFTTAKQSVILNYAKPEMVLNETNWYVYCCVHGLFCNYLKMTKTG